MRVFFSGTSVIGFFFLGFHDGFFFLGHPVGRAPIFCHWIYIFTNGILGACSWICWLFAAKASQCNLFYAWKPRTKKHSRKYTWHSYMKSPNFSIRTTVKGGRGGVNLGSWNSECHVSMHISFKTSLWKFYKTAPDTHVSDSWAYTQFQGDPDMKRRKEDRPNPARPSVLKLMVQINRFSL